MLQRVIDDPAAIARFWANVDAEPTPEGCRLWTGRMSPGTGPRLHFGRHVVQPKRIAWSLAHRTLAISGKMLVTCGNDRCVEPAHLHWQVRAGARPRA